MKWIIPLLILTIIFIAGCAQNNSNQTTISNEQNNIQVQTTLNNSFENDLAILPSNFGPMPGGYSYLRMLNYYPVYSEDLMMSNRFRLLKDDKEDVDSFFIGEYRSISASFDALILVINTKSSKLIDDIMKSSSKGNSTETGKEVYFFEEDSECYYFFTDNNTLVVSITDDCYLGEGLIDLVADRTRNVTKLYEMYPLIETANEMPSTIGNYTYYQAISYYEKGDPTIENVANPWGENSSTIQFFYNNSNSSCNSTSYCYNEDKINPRIIYNVNINYLAEISSKLEQYILKIKINNSDCYAGNIRNFESNKTIPFISGGNGNLDYSIVCITNNSILRTDSLSTAKELSKLIQENLIELIKRYPSISTNQFVIEKPSKEVNELKGFNIRLDSLTKNVTPGEYFEYTVTIYGLNNSTNNVNTSINYTIASVNSGNLIVKDSESIIVNKSLTFNRKLLIPFNTTVGLYTIEAKAYYNNSLAVSVSSFNVT